MGWFKDWVRGAGPLAAGLAEVKEAIAAEAGDRQLKIQTAALLIRIKERVKSIEIMAGIIGRDATLIEGDLDKIDDVAESARVTKAKKKEGEGKDE